MAIEIERKFLADAAPVGRVPARIERIQQGYLAVEPGGPEVRIRSKGEAYYLTVKQLGGLTRGEWETAITKQQFDALWPATEGRRVEKVRSVFPVDGHQVEVDVFEGRLAGLCLMEVEFDDLAASSAFVAPAWMGREVTGQAAFKNRNLAIRTPARP